MPVDREKMARAVADFLDAAGVDASDPELLETPSKVTEAWADELIVGHDIDLAKVLAETSAATHHDPVILKGVSFVGVCPHHLLPYEGTANLCYLPGERVAGFGSLVRAVKSLGARLVLQEVLARDVARGLVEHLGARGAGCVIEARQGCVGLRGVCQPKVRTITSAWAGCLEDASRRASLEQVMRGEEPCSSGG